MKHPSKNGVKIDPRFLMDFWRQVRRENGAKIDPRRHRKSDGKMEGTKMATR